MKTAILSAFLALSLSAHAAPVAQQRPGPAVPADAALISGDTMIEDGVLTIAIRSTGPEITPWIHVFLDLGDSRRSYNHNSERPCGFGMEIMLEGDIAYRFNSDDPSVWAWTPIEGASVDRRISGDVLTLRLPVAALGLPGHRSIHVFAVAYTPDYQDTLDTLPRENTPWRVTLINHKLSPSR